MFYAAIILVLVGTNLHRFRRRSAEHKPAHNPSRQSAKTHRKSREYSKVAVGDDSEVVYGTTDYIIDLESNEDDAVALPLLTNDVHIQKSCVQPLETSNYIESIEVTHHSDDKQTYTHSLIDSSLLEENNYCSHDDSELESNSDCSETRENPPKVACGLHCDNNGNRSFTSQILQNVGNLGCEGGGFGNFSHDKMSTTVVSRNGLATTAAKQKVRVGLTEEEEEKPRALLEMMGDDAADPVPV